MESTELIDGVHRVEHVQGDKILAYHMIEGHEGPIFVDSGSNATPTDLYQPLLEEHDWLLTDVSLVVITHADADHHGGNGAVRFGNPSVTIAAHEADTELIESGDRLLDDRYRQFDRHGVTYTPEMYAALEEMLGPDEPVDVALRGGESIRGANQTFRILHTPGHTSGHLVLYDSDTGLLLGADAFFGRGLRSPDGEVIQPPPYENVRDYRNTIRLVSALDPEVVSFTHYDTMTGDEIDAFVQESRDFVDEMDELVSDLLAERDRLTLVEAIEETVDRLGSFGLDTDLAYPLTAHLNERVERGEASTTVVDGDVVWESD